MKVLVTGAAGFIGYHVSRRLAETKRCEVLGVDNLNDYYSVDLKRARLAELEKFEEFRFVQSDFSDAAAFGGIYSHFKPDYVVHLGAQAGVRYSSDNPAAYVQSNITGFLNVLEACRSRPPKHLVFASSSSIYGAGAKLPFSEDQITDQPISFYGATKKSNELMAYSYAHLHKLRITGLRFFTVYGPWGRPDMSPILFAKAICEGKPLKLFNEGKSHRDFTYINDIVDGILKVLLYPPALSKVEGPTEPVVPPYQVFNLGHHRPVEMRLFVSMLEKLLGRIAQVELLPAQPGDLPETCASIDRVKAAVGYEPRTSLDDGLAAFVEWFKAYYKI
ncbi:MAG: NAD-dependent epimerase/dehydratase family protein [Nibricoccus sp.]